MADEETKPQEPAPEKSTGQKASELLKAVAPVARLTGIITSWPVIGLMLLIGLGAILLGLSIFAIACSGFFGNACKQDAPVDSPDRKTVVEVMNKSEKTLAKAESDAKITATETGPDGKETQAEFCQKVIPDEKDREFLDKGYTTTKTTIGINREVKIQPDISLITALKYLCKKHSRLGISHFISAYIDMKLDPESTKKRDPQIIRNISAHTKGQAFDLTEIDYVYKVWRPGPCTAKTGDFDVYYFNDRDEVKLYLPCKEKPDQATKTEKYGPLSQAIPIQVVWQDQQGTFALGGLPLNMDTALQILGDYLGLPPEALQFATGDLQGMLEGIGKTYFEQLLGLPLGSFAGGSLEDFLKSTFDAKLADLLGQLPGTSFGFNLSDWVSSAGAGFFEQALGLFPGSLQGWGSPQALFQSIGLETLSHMLRIPSSVLSDPQAAVKALENLSTEDLAVIGKDLLGAKALSVIAALKAGDAASPESLQALGQEVLEKTLQVPAGSLAPCEPTETEVGDNGRTITIKCGDPFAKLEEVAKRTGIDLETLKKFVGIFLTEEAQSQFAFDPAAIKRTAQSLGISDFGAFRFLTILQGSTSLGDLEDALGLPVGSLANILSGGSSTFDSGTLQQLAKTLGIDTSAAQNLLNALKGVQNFGALEGLLGLPSGSLASLFSGGAFGSFFQGLGIPLFEQALGLPSGSLTQLLSGAGFTFDQATIQNIANLLGIDAGIAGELLNLFQSGGSLYTIIQQIGSSILGEAFNLDDPLALFKIVTGIAPDVLITQVQGQLQDLLKGLNLPLNLLDIGKLLSGDLSGIASLFQGLGGFQLGEIFGLSLGDIQQLLGGDLSVLLNLPAFQSLLGNIFGNLGLDLSSMTGFLQGNPMISQLAGLGSSLNGVMSLLGIDQFLVMELVYKPEAQYKVHLVVKELLDMPFDLGNINLRVTQLIVHSKERDVTPFEKDGTLDKVYGEDRPVNYGLFSMPEAKDHVHVGY
jgi:transcriptional regulator with XRE-family HTH domain